MKTQCPPPGVYHNIEADVYHSWDAVSSTFVKGFAVNPFKAVNMPFKGSPSADLGSAIHAFVLEGRDAFNKVFFVAEEIPCPEGQNPKGWKSTNIYKELNQLSILEADGRILLTPDQWASVVGVEKSLKEHPMTKQMINRGFNEVSLVYRDPSSGLTIKARLDDHYESVPSDLKTSADIAWVHRDLYKRHWELQAALYSLACEANGLPVSYFCFLAAQTTETYPVRVGYLHPDRLAAAKTEVNRLFGLIKECRERNSYPNFTIPIEIHSLDELSAASLLEEW